MNVFQNMRPVRMFLGVPQVDKIQVYKVQEGRNAVITQVILTNTEKEDTSLTLTINTIDLLRDYVVPAGKSEVIDLFIVLNGTDTVSLKQETANAINVSLSGQVG